MQRIIDKKMIQVDIGTTRFLKNILLIFNLILMIKNVTISMCAPGVENESKKQFFY
jgi:hypothetical protein